MNSELDPFFEFMENGFHQIDGWPGQMESVRFLHNFRPFFENSSSKSGACEIGVHHGKYLIALHNLFYGLKESVGIDLFEDQQKNLDGSGSGSKSICEKHIRNFARNPASVSLISQDSLNYNQRETQRFISSYDPFLIFSVDGGHTALHLVNDFLFAAKVLAPEGIIIVDDIFHPDWPGVTEGVYTLISNKLSSFVPFFLTRKKLFFCSLSLQSSYRNIVRDKAEGWKKDVEFFGNQIISVSFGSEY